jgi:hypothetical protein
MAIQAASTEPAERAVTRLTAREKRGYWFWGPVALVIFVTEVLGMGKFETFDKWPTISTTIGDLQDRNSLWGLPVVALVTLAAFYAIAYERPADDAERDEFKLLDRQFATRHLELRYTASFVLICTLLSVVVALSFFTEKIERGWIIYGTLAIVAIVIPLVLALLPSPRDVAFPNLFYTFACLRGRWRAATAVVVAGLAILVLHLALYPWPDLAREHKEALKALSSTPNVKTALAFSTVQRSVASGENAWHVYFHDLVDGVRVHKGCFVVVSKGRAGVASPDCLRSSG